MPQPKSSEGLLARGRHAFEPGGLPIAGCDTHGLADGKRIRDGVGGIGSRARGSPPGSYNNHSDRFSDSTTV